MQEPVQLHRDGEDQTFSALDEDDFQTIIVENKLGSEMYLKKAEQNADKVEQLQHGDCVSFWVPPPMFVDRLNVADSSREPRYYVVVQILEAKVFFLLFYLSGYICFVR